MLMQHICQLACECAYIQCVVCNFSRHTPVRQRHDVRSERRMRQVNVAPSDPPVS